MKTLLTFLVLVLTAHSTVAQDFVVVNKCPTSFVVVNKITEPDLPTDPNVPAPAGYQWIKYGSNPWKLEKLITAAPEVAAPPGNFQGRSSNGAYNPSHRCQNCGHQSPPGTGTWIVRGSNPDGTHVHECPQCHDRWRH